MGHIPMGVTFNFVDQVGSPWPDELMARYNLVPQGISAEMIADKWEIPRSELDELGLRSHQNAARATEEGRFERETIPMTREDERVRGDGRGRPGHPPGHEPREAVAAEAGLQGGRQGDRRELEPDLRRRRRGAADDAREGRRVRPQAARPDHGPDHRRRGPGDHAHRPDPRDAQAARAQQDEDGRHRPRRDQRGVRVRGRGLAARARARHGPGQRQRRRDRARAPARDRPARA